MVAQKYCMELPTTFFLKVFQISGVVMILGGFSLFFGIFLKGSLGIELLGATFPGESAGFYYFLASFGALFIGWGSLIISTEKTKNFEAIRRVSVASSLGFALLALIRFYGHFLTDIREVSGFFPIIESEVLAIVSIFFFFFIPAQKELPQQSVMDRIRQVYQSLRRMPMWVQIWINVFLFPVNLAAFFLSHTEIGWYASLAFAFVLVFNLPIVAYLGGMNRMMSVTHIIPWTPLLIYVSLRLTSGEITNPIELYYGIMLLAVNGISLALDSLETVRWFKGETELLGMV